MAGAEEWAALPLLLCTSFHPHTPNWISLAPKKAVIKTAPSLAMMTVHMGLVISKTPQNNPVDSWQAFCTFAHIVLGKK